MTARRFDTDALLQQLLEHNEEAFKAIYERYRGRVYRFIVRQCGNGEEGQAEYLSIWANLLKSRLTCTDGRSLKLCFLKSLHRPTFKPPVDTRMVIPMTLMPRELEAEGGWSTLLVEMIRRLPDGLRKRFLFRYEIGLSIKAIANIFKEDRKSTQQKIIEAEQRLIETLNQAGYRLKDSMEEIYRETRSLGPPSIWDKEVLLRYQSWMHKGVPEELLKLSNPHEPENKLETIKSQVWDFLVHLRSDFSAKIGRSHHSTT